MYQELVDRIDFYIDIINKIPTPVVELLTRDKFTPNKKAQEFWKKELKKRNGN